MEKINKKVVKSECKKPKFNNTKCKANVKTKERIVFIHNIAKQMKKDFYKIAPFEVKKEGRKSTKLWSKTQIDTFFAVWSK